MLSANSAVAEQLLDQPNDRTSCFGVGLINLELKHPMLLLDTANIEPMGNDLFLINSDARQLAAIQQFLTLADCRSQQQYTLRLGFWDENTPNSNVDAFREAAVTAADDVVEDLARRFEGGYLRPLWMETCTCLRGHMPK